MSTTTQQDSSSTSGSAAATFDTLDSAYRLDWRDRTHLYESFYVDRVHSAARFLVADPKADAPVIVAFLLDLVAPSNGVVVSADESREMLHRLLISRVRRWLDEGRVVLATEMFEVVGLAAGRFVTSGDVHMNKEDDSRLGSLINKVDKAERSIVAKKGGRVFVLEAIGVHENWQRGGVGNRLVKHLLRFVRDESDAKAFVTVSTTSATTRLAMQFNAIESQTVELAASSTTSLDIPQKKNTTANTVQLLIVNDLHESTLTEKLVEKPRLPEDYRLDASLHRPVRSSRYVQKLGRSITFVQALPEDERVVVNFICNEYFRSTATMRCLREWRKVYNNMQIVAEVPKQYMHENLSRWKPECLAKGLVFLGVDNGYVCGVAVNEHVTVEHKSDESSKSLDIPDEDDFNKLLDSATMVTHRGAKATRAVCIWFKSLMPQLVPTECSRVFCWDMLTVQPDYQGCHVGLGVWLESLKRAAELGDTHIMTETTAVGSTRLAEKLGCKKPLSFPYENMIYKGEHLFPTGASYDGGRHFSLLVGEVATMMEHCKPMFEANK